MIKAEDEKRWAWSRSIVAYIKNGFLISRKLVATSEFVVISCRFYCSSHCYSILKCKSWILWIRSNYFRTFTIKCCLIHFNDDIPFLFALVLYIAFIFSILIIFLFVSHLFILSIRSVHGAVVCIPHSFSVSFLLITLSYIEKMKTI